MIGCEAKSENDPESSSEVKSFVLRVLRRLQYYNCSFIMDGNYYEMVYLLRTSLYKLQTDLKNEIQF